MRPALLAVLLAALVPGCGRCVILKDVRKSSPTVLRLRSAQGKCALKEKESHKFIRDEQV
jgi:hypothetical protein